MYFIDGNFDISVNISNHFVHMLYKSAPEWFMAYTLCYARIIARTYMLLCDYLNVLNYCLLQYIL